MVTGARHASKSYISSHFVLGEREVSALNHNNYRRIENAEGYVLIAVYLFIYLFVCVLLA